MEGKKVLRRDLGLWTVILLVVANTFSGSIFVLLSEGASATGTLLPLSYLLGAFLAFLIGAVYAEVSSSMPKAGANLAYAFRAYGRGPTSFILSWFTILGHIAYGAVNAFGFGLYLAVFLHVPAMIVAIVIVCLFSLINLRGVGDMGGIGKWSVIISMSLAFIFVILVCLHIDFSWHRLMSLFEVPTTSYFSIFSGTALIFGAFMGFEGVSSLAQEIKEPSKNIPRAIFSVIGITSLLYFGIACLVVYALPIKQLIASGAPLSALAKQSAGQLALIAISASALLATATALLMDILISSRKIYAVAEVGYLPKALMRVSKRGTPYLAVVAVGVSMILLVLSNSVTFIAYLGNGTYFLFAAMLAFGVIIMRRKRPFLQRPFHVPFFPLVPITTILLSLLILFNSGLSALFWLLLWALIGFIIYLASLLSRERLPWFFYGIFAACMIILFLLHGILT